MKASISIFRPPRALLGPDGIESRASSEEARHSTALLLSMGYRSATSPTINTTTTSATTSTNTSAIIITTTKTKPVNNLLGKSQAIPLNEMVLHRKESPEVVTVYVVRVEIRVSYHARMLRGRMEGH